MYLKAVRQYQNRAQKFMLLQNETRLELIIETVDVDPIRIVKDVAKLIGEKQSDKCRNGLPSGQRDIFS